MPIRNSLTIVIAAVVSLTCYETATRNRFASIISHAMEIIEDSYVEDVEPRTLFENAMHGMVNQLDEYSDYIGPKDFQQFQQSIDQEFVGIGVVVEGPPEVPDLRVVSPVYDSPAYRAGMRAGDAIIEIDGVSTHGLSLTDAVKKMKGLPDSTVELTIRHRGEERTVKLVIKRELIRTKSVLGDTLLKDGRWNYFLEEEPRIGYIRMTTFGEHSVEELRAVLPFEDHPIEALILDLRGNVGGLLNAAVSVCDMFIDRGLIVRIRGRKQRIEGEHTASPNETIFDLSIPMVVLVDRYSASASEIVAACLKDHDRAVIVGQRTWGKGTVQNVIPLEKGTSALKLTTASYWRPSGKNIHRRRDAKENGDWGVRPSKGFEVKLTDDQYRQVYEQRRARDILQSDSATLEPTEVDESFEDLQRKRAVDYLKKKLAPDPA